ncbi:MAG: hypothetical protein ACXVIH_12030 [Ilumatobacteraceae bacterium]
MAIALVLGASGCSASSTPAQPPASTTTVPASSGSPPRVDLIGKAITALETKLGAPQQYFEINATSHLVNLFVALNDGKVVQPWVYLDGELSSTEGHSATGFSFSKAALDFDPARVLSQLLAQLPQSTPDVFFIEGGQGGVVRYSVTVSSKQGGQLVVVLGPDGTVKSVET